MIAVPPPPRQTNVEVASRFEDVIFEYLDSLGISYLRLRTEKYVGEDGLLLEEFRARDRAQPQTGEMLPDHHHGNDEYGKTILAEILELM